MRPIREPCKPRPEVLHGDPDDTIFAADHIRTADTNEPAWWLGQLACSDNRRTLGALCILKDAVQ